MKIKPNKKRKQLTLTRSLFPVYTALGCLCAMSSYAQPATGTYFIYNRNSAENLDAFGGGTANGTQIIQWEYNGVNNQQWNLNSLGNGQYSIIGVGSGSSLDMGGFSTVEGAPVELWGYNGGNNQRFTLESRGGSFYSIVFVHDGQALNVFGGSTTEGTNVIQWADDGGWNSQWRFQTLSPAAYPQSSGPWYPKYLGNVSATTGKTVPLIFDGDSITDFWNGNSVWNTYWAPKGAYDFGISADRTENLWWRLQEGESDNLNTKLVVLLIGTNNTPTDDAPTIASKITSIVNDYLTHCPNAHILLMGIFPRGQEPNTALRNQIIAVNNQISTLNGTGGGRVIYKDIGAQLLQSDGTISTNILYDYTHPTVAGYQIWANAISPIVNQYVP